MRCTAGRRKFQFLIVACVCLVSFGPVLAQDRVQKSVEKPSSKGPTGATLSFSRLAEDSTKFSMVVSDGEETVVTATFTSDQLKLVHAVMREAKEFALTDEGAGNTEATTTRFSDPD